VWQPIPAALLGLAFVHLGRARDALPLLEEAVTLARDLGVNAYLALWMAHLAEGLLAAGDLDGADTVAHQALDAAIAFQEYGHEAYVTRVLADIALAADPPALDKAEASFRRALALAEDRGMRALVAHCYAGLGRVAERAGNGARAEEYLRTAIALFGAMAVGVWKQRTESILARLLDTPSASGADRIARILFVVSREEVSLYNELVREFKGKENIRIVVDRRTIDRRTGTTEPSVDRRGDDRRGDDRRVRSHTDSQLRALGWSIIRFDPD
jgi:tetratricopeptide (TPR) repeat protein